MVNGNDKGKSLEKWVWDAEARTSTARSVTGGGFREVIALEVNVQVPFKALTES